MNIKLYHQNGCPMCKTVEMLLEKNNIIYESHKDLEEMKSLGIVRTPALMVDDTIMLGRDIIDWIKSNGGNR